MEKERDDYITAKLQEIEQQLQQATKERQQLRSVLETIQQKQSQVIELLNACALKLDIGSDQDGHTTTFSQLQTETKSPLKPPTPPPAGDYTHLEALLSNHQWKEADLETAKIVLAVTGQTSQGYLSQPDFSNIPCSDLAKIDQLWLNASEGKFGLTLQRQLYQNMGGKKFFHPQLWRDFGEKLGWYVDNSWRHYDQLNFSTSAPIGHLPVMGDSQVWFVSGWEGSYDGFSNLLLRLIQCHL